MKSLSDLQHDLNPQKFMKEAVIYEIIEKFPEAAVYKSQFRFKYRGNQVDVDLDLLPPDLASRIQAEFSRG